MWTDKVSQKQISLRTAAFTTLSLGWAGYYCGGNSVTDSLMLLWISQVLVQSPHQHLGNPTHGVLKHTQCIQVITTKVEDKQTFKFSFYNYWRCLNLFWFWLFPKVDQVSANLEEVPCTKSADQKTHLNISIAKWFNAHEIACSLSSSEAVSRCSLEEVQLSNESRNECPRIIPLTKWRSNKHRRQHFGNPQKKTESDNSWLHPSVWLEIWLCKPLWADTHSSNTIALNNQDSPNLSTELKAVQMPKNTGIWPVESKTFF